MINVVAFSGGKDSAATLLIAQDKHPDCKAIFCDTGWESPVTYDYLSYIEAETGIHIARIVGAYTFEKLAEKKKRVPSARARFCTEELKIKPMIDWILTQTDDVVIHQGIRRDESTKRRKYKMNDSYFEADYKYYRRKDVDAWLNKYTCDVHRPIIEWSAQDVFDFLKVRGVEANPLYKQGFARVGCFPCIMCRHTEIKQIIKHHPERIDKIRELEQKLGTSFFPVDYIPRRFCKNKQYPFIDEVVAYLHRPEQKEMFTPPACQSIYAICE